jgi:hypothetical protein
VEILLPASSERADVCTNRRIRLTGLRSEEAEIIGLLADILGWDVDPSGGDSATSCRDGSGRDGSSRDGGLQAAFAAVDPAVPWPVVDWDSIMPVRDGAAICGWGDYPGLYDHWAQNDPACATRAGQRLFQCSGQGSAQATEPPRLALRQAGNMICVDTADAELAAQLARLGLDRLVLPVALSALEDLITFAG